MKGFLTAVVVIGIILAFVFVTQMQNNQFTKPSDNALSQLPGNTQNPNQASTGAELFNQGESKGVQTMPKLTLTQNPITASTTATINTAKGDIVIHFYPQDAPKTVTNFVTLAANGYYNNLTFHRVEPGFVIQGGDPNGNGTGGRSIYGDTFEDELNPAAQSYQEGYKEGVVAMANRGPNTNGSQFFIMLADNLGLPKNYTIFGKVVKGMDVVKQIQKGDRMLRITVQ